ncbi:MAG: phospholipid carrier-dependent glycosyltransferase [Alphaproteobacteria bacterium]|nr:phospholipid carrier-dependent glycosyltransferase [Alphaproteobacteria bacterium]
MFLILSAFFSFEAGKRPLASPDEGRYCEIPREMLESGNYLTPRLNTVKYFEKPPLFYWMQATSFQAFGYNDFAARLANIFIALVGCMITFVFGWHMVSPRVGILSCLILATSLLYYGISRIVILDMTVSVFITGAILTMARGLLMPTGRLQKTFVVASYVFCALGFLTKGVIGFSIPGSIILIWILVNRQWGWFRTALNPIGILIFLALVIPWHALVSLKNPEFAYFYFIHEHIIRLVTQSHQRYQPFWFFIPIFIGGLFPWIGFFVMSLKEYILCLRQKLNSPYKSLLNLLCLWIGFIIFLFSLSQSKLIPYILPAFPAAALWLGHFINEHILSAPSDQSAKRLLDRSFQLNILLSLGLIVVGLLLPFPSHMPSHIGTNGKIIITILIAGGAFIPWVLQKKKMPYVAILALIIAAMATNLYLNHLSEHFQRPSSRALALAIKDKISPEVPIICFEFYPQELPFYLGRPVMISGWLGELAFGASVEDKTDLIFDHTVAAKIWHISKQAIVFVRDDNFEAFRSTIKSPFHIVGQHFNLFMISKLPLDLE